MPRSKEVTVLPEPWRSMTEEDAAKFTEAESRRMLAAVTTPALEKLRIDVRAMRTSEIVLGLGHSQELSKRLLTDEDLDKYGAADEMLIMGAAIVALGDELDRRIPRP